MRSFFLSVCTIPAVTAVFSGLNNIAMIPWEIMQYLWYAWLPCCTAAISVCYGLSAGRSGGSILTAALLLTPILLVSHKVQLPFASTLTFLPSIILSSLLALPMEILGRSTKRKNRHKTVPAKHTI